MSQSSYVHIFGFVRTFLFALFIYPCVQAFGQSPSPSSQNDFFPLADGRRWRYLFEAMRYNYNGIFIDHRSRDSGTVTFRVLSHVSNDSSILWTIEERDTVMRHVEEFTPPQPTPYSDTTFPVVDFGSMVLTEKSDSAHELIATPIFGVWQFPPRWPLNDDTVGRPIYRFSSDSLRRISTDGIYYGNGMSDSLEFTQNVGLSHAAFSIAGTGPNYSRSYWAWLLDGPTEVKNIMDKIPDAFRVFQNYPNPFNSQTTIDIELVEDSHTTIQVFDILGRHIATLVQGRFSAGRHSFRWGSSNSSSGVYICKVQADRFQKSITLLLLK